jgi:hypothetical protein
LTKANHALSVIGIISGAAVLTLSVATLIACNCPQVFIDQNGVYDFKSGLYSGAVYSNLERTDYLPLEIFPGQNEEISLKIANVKNEEQFINKVELLQVNHAAGQEVLADRHGIFYTFTKTTAPVLAVAGDGYDVQNVLAQKDSRYYPFDNNAGKHGFSFVNLTFNKPENAGSAKLIIHARNSYWGGLVHKEFVYLFGNDFEKWRNKQEKEDPNKLVQWQTDQALPLMVYAKTKKGWELVDYYPLVGNTASRDMIMQIDTKNIEGNTIEIKLETVYRFWDLDFAGIEYNGDDNLTTTLLQPLVVMKSDSTDVNALLQKDDSQYLHLKNDEFVALRYAAPPAGNNIQSSYFLVSGGYYHTLEHGTGKADFSKLLRFKNAGEFDKFSREKYKEAQELAAFMKELNEK